MGLCRLDPSVSASSAAADFVACLQQENAVISVSSVSSALCNLLPNDFHPNVVVQNPKLEQCLFALNAQLQDPSHDVRSNVLVLECCSLAQSFFKISIDEYWLARMVLSLGAVCTQGNSSQTACDDFVICFCKDFATFAGRCDHRSITIIRTISVVACFLHIPTLLYECFCIAFNASSTLNVIPSLLFHSARFWPAPFSREASSCPLLALFIACIIDPSSQSSFSVCEAAHAVAFLYTVCDYRFSFTSVAQTVPFCVASMSGSDAGEALVACKFAVSVLDASSIWSSVAEPILSMLHRHFDSSSLVQAHSNDSPTPHLQPPIAARSHDSILDSVLATENVTHCIKLLGHAVSEIIQQSELFSTNVIFQISPAIRFLFSICCREKPPGSPLRYSSNMPASPSEVASCTFKELTIVACKLSQYRSVLSDFNSLDSMEALWSRMLSPISLDLRSVEGPLLPHLKRPCFTNSSPD